MKIHNLLPLIILFLLFIPFFNNSFTVAKTPAESSIGTDFSPNSKLNLSQLIENFSRYNLTVFMDEVNSKVSGNLTVDFYNNDPVNLTMIPFHLYLSGMNYDTRPGSIEILNVVNFENSSVSLPYVVYSDLQIMWVNLTTNLEYQKRPICGPYSIAVAWTPATARDRENAMDGKNILYSPPTSDIWVNTSRPTRL